MLEKIIRVEPTTPMITLTWMIGARCNYDCMYCPDDLHDSTSAHPDLEKLKKAWHSIYTKTQHIGLPYKISFTGGEVTANKSFLPLVRYLRENDFNIGQIIVTTNGSASLRYYKELAELVNSISFSTHSEYMDEQHFFTTVRELDKIMIRPEKSIHVNVMDEFWNTERNKMYCDWLSQHNISHSLNTVDYSTLSRAEPELRGVRNFEGI